MSFLNKVVLITGAGSGIGEKTALHFAKLSARLALIDVNDENFKKTVETCEKLSRTKVYKVAADLTNDEEVKKAVQGAFKHYGRIDVLVNGNDIFGPGTILDADVMESFDQIMAINTRTTVAVIHYAAPALIASKGCIINISSSYANVIMTNVPYTTAKASLNHITRCLALDFGLQGVRVNAVTPGLVRTDDNEAVNKKNADLTPLKRTVKIEDVTELIAFLASDKARGITGVNYSIDSGVALVGAGKMEEIVGKLQKQLLE